MCVVDRPDHLPPAPLAAWRVVVGRSRLHRAIYFVHPTAGRSPFCRHQRLHAPYHRNRCCCCCCSRIARHSRFHASFENERSPSCLRLLTDRSQREAQPSVRPSTRSLASFAADPAAEHGCGVAAQTAALYSLALDVCQFATPRPQCSIHSPSVRPNYSDDKRSVLSTSELFS